MWFCEVPFVDGFVYTWRGKGKSLVLSLHLCISHVCTPQHLRTSRKVSFLESLAKTEALLSVHCLETCSQNGRGFGCTRFLQEDLLAKYSRTMTTSISCATPKMPWQKLDMWVCTPKIGLTHIWFFTRVCLWQISYLSNPDPEDVFSTN